MKILKLKLRGAIGIMKGLGVDEIEIDFTQFEPGLIALTGKNGSGKTTIMENLHPYRTMVSRNGSLQSHFFLKDSYRILTFEHESTVFESRIMIDGLTGGSEAYLFRVNPENNESIPLNDGKLTTFDIAIVKLLGSQELFFNSVFSGQKSKGIAELKPADRRKLFYELLNLNVYEDYLDTAKSELKKHEIKLSETEGQINALQTDGHNLVELNTLIKDLTGNKEGMERSISELEIQIDQIEKEIRDSEIKLSSFNEKINFNEEIKNKIHQLREKGNAEDNAYTAKRAELVSDVEAARKAIERDKKLIENKAVIEAKLTDIYNCNSNLSKLQNDRGGLQLRLVDIQNKYRNDLEKIESNAETLRDMELNIVDLESRRDKNSDEIKRIQEDSKIIDDSGCDSPTQGSACKFLSNAHAGRDKLGELDNYNDELTKIIKENSDLYNNDLAKYNSEKDDLTQKHTAEAETLQNKIDIINANIEGLQAEIAGLKQTDWDKLKNECDEADNNIKLNEAKTESLDQQIGSLDKNYSERMKELTAELYELEEKLDDQLIEKINQEKESLNNLSGQKTDLQGSLTEQRSTLTDLNTAISATNQKIETAKQNETKIKELEASKQIIQSEIKDWTFLVKCFDKTGIPVLKLENSGIEITTIANELLSLFENKFRIVFETTSLKKDKKSYKETFDINIIEDGGVTEIANKSGGQQVYLETAIRLAISDVVKRQGKDIQTSFLDEADGALDLDNAYNYIEMIRRSHDMSGVHNTFVITHRTELLDLIPQQVKLTDGYLQIINN